MNSKRLFILLSVSLGVILVGLIFTTYGITNLLKTKSVALSENKALVEQLSTKQNGIAKSKQDIAQYSELEAVTKKIVPQDKDQAEAVRQITGIAKASKVPLTAITFPTSTLGGNAASGGVKPSGANATTAKPNLSQLTPVANIPGVYNLQITLGNNTNNPVTFAQLNTFLRGLENNRRTAAVASVNIQPQSNNPDSLVFTLVINIYIKPS